MKKYIDADKLIAEIQKRIEETKSMKPSFDQFWAGQISAFKGVKTMITSLQQEQPDTKESISHLEHWLAFFGCPEENIEKCATQIAQGYGAIRYIEGIRHGAEAFNELAQQEQPDNEDIDKVAQELYEHLYELKRRNNVPTNLYDKQEIIDLWKAGIEYGYNHPKQEQSNNMIQWTGNNLKEVIDFTGKSPRFGEWFKSWEVYENYVHSHNDILKLFCEDGSYYEVPVGAWIVKTPDGYNVPSVARFIHAKHEQPEVELEKDIDAFFDKWDKNSNGTIFDENGARVTIETIKGVVKHFLNARKEK